MSLYPVINRHRFVALALAAIMAVAVTFLLAAPWPASGQNPADQEVPARPTGLTGTVSPDDVSLSWDDPGDGSITGYQVLRRNPAVDAKGVFHTVVDDTGSSGTSYVDTTVAAATRYFYRVLARNAAGLSPRSGLFRADVPPPDPDATRPGATDLGDVTSQEGVIHRDGSVNGASDRLDYFRFTLTAARTVELALRRQDANGDLYLEDGDGNELASSENGGDANESIAERLGAGTYYVRVAARAGGNNNYRLRYGTSPGPEQSTPENSAASGSPAITGTAQVHETLSADTAGIADANGLSNVEYAYRWVRTSGGVDTDIGDATGSSYTLVRGDLSHTIKVRVSFTDDDGYSETLASSPAGPVVRPPNVAATGAPTIRGVVAVGKTLNADTSGITDDNGLTGVSFTHQWVKRTGGADADITGETSSSYTIKASDADSAFKVTVAFTDDDGYSETLTSAPTEVLETEGQNGQDNDVQPRAAPTDSPQNLRANIVSYSDVDLEWDAPDTGITHIRIVRTGGNLPDDTLVEALSVNRESRAFVRLEPDTGYTFTVEFGSSATEFGPAATLNVRTLPIPAPTNVRVDSQKTTVDRVRVTFKWDNPDETTFLKTSVAVYDATLQIEEYIFNSTTDLLASARLNLDPDTTLNFATWYRTVDANGIYHAGPKAYVQFTTARLPEVSISDASVEEGGTLTFTLTITDFADGREAIVSVSSLPTLGDDENEDYSSNPGGNTHPFAFGETTKTLEFTTVDDDLYEGDETIQVELSNPTGLIIGRGTATGTIIDNDPLPLLSPLDSEIAEDDPRPVCIESEPAAEQPFDVALRYSGTATPGADYTGVNTLTLAGGKKTHCHITIIDDNIYEGDETIIYTLQEDPGSYRVDPDGKTATITIRENDPVPSLTVTAFPPRAGINSPAAG